MKKKILVLTADYPDNNGGVSLMYVHIRNKYYIQHGINVTVLNFKTISNYEINGVKVISLKSYEDSIEQYDILVSHAANLRNHYRFLKKYDRKFAHMIFFFHGHEILKINEAYPKPYEYVKKSGKLRYYAQNIYDRLKLFIWHRYYKKSAFRTEFVFVSNWLFKEFQKNVGLSRVDLHGHVHIISNSVGSEFEQNFYPYNGDKKYDFITIRSYMDNSKYCVDLVDELAKRNPQYKFLIIGRGKYYKVHSAPENVIWIERFLSHREILDYIDQSRCGLLLTREDTQGVMTCELAEYGIPVITSDIDVCREICGDLRNVRMISNHISSVDLVKEYESLLDGMPYEKQGKFSYKNTVSIEEKLIRSL